VGLSGVSCVGVRRLLVAALILPGSGGALAQTTQFESEQRRAAATSSSEDDDTIVVTGQSQRAAAVGDIRPEQTLNAGDVRALGVGSVAELLQDLAPQTRSDRGRGGEQPVTLLNGRRVSSFAEIRNIPAEAIERVDILPEEVALKYGYSADQRVVNIVLRRRFRAVTTEVEGGQTTDGGGKVGTVEGTLLHVRREQRLNLHLEYRASAAITEADRNLVSRSGGRPFDRAGNIVGLDGGEIDPGLSALVGTPVTIAGVPGAVPTLADFAATANRANSTNVGRFRTIRPETRSFNANVVYSRTILGNVGATINASLDRSDSDSRRGLPGASLLVPGANPFSPFGQDTRLFRYLGDDPLLQNVRTVTGHLGFTLDKDIAHWRLSLTGNYDHGETRTRTGRGNDVTALQAAIIGGVNPFGTYPAGLLDVRLVDRAKSTSDSGNLQFVATGPVARLPAGEVGATFKAGIDTLQFDARSLRSGTIASSDLSRTDVNGRFNLDLPLTSRRERVLAAIGDLSLNINGGFDRYSDFGTLGTWGYGASWKPTAGVSLIYSASEERGPPSVQQLGNPVIVTPDVQTFDYATGRTIDIVQTGGGNPALDADRRRVTKIGLTLKPFKADVTLTANFIDSRIRNAIANFPEPTAAIERAFPDRFTRDADGDLVAIDARPINFSRQDRSELRWGVDFTHRLKTSEALLQAIRDSPRAKRERERRRAEAVARGEAPPRRPDEGIPGAAVLPDGRAGAAPGSSGGGTRGRGGFRGPGGGLAQGGRIAVSFFHTWHFKDEVLIRPGLPRLDLLNGDALGSNGGTSRHELEAQFNYANNGIGLRLTGNWQSGSTVRAPTPAGTLRFSPHMTANARLFINLNQQIRLLEQGWAQGARLALKIDNIFNARRDVRDGTGATPLRYQGGYLDPAGRVIRIEFRKLLF